jgi:hypothetical protein
MYWCDMTDDVSDFFIIFTRSEAPFVYKICLAHAYCQHCHVEG